MKIAILVDNLYQVLEVWYPYYRLKEAGMDVDFIAPEVGVYKSKEGYPAEVGLSIHDVEPEDYDAVVVPGGFAPDHLRRHELMVQFVKKVNEKQGVVAAICHGPWLLASADVLRGKKATSFFAIKTDVVNAGASYEDQSVVVDGNLITSRKPDDLPAFCQAIIHALGT